MFLRLTWESYSQQFIDVLEIQIINGEVSYNLTREIDPNGGTGMIPINIQEAALSFCRALNRHDYRNSPRIIEELIWSTELHPISRGCLYGDYLFRDNDFWEKLGHIEQILQCPV